MVAIFYGTIVGYSVLQHQLLDIEADANVPRYADLTPKHHGWRFDFAILEGESPMGRGGKGVRDFSGEDITKVLADAVVRVVSMRTGVSRGGR